MHVRAYPQEDFISVTFFQGHSDWSMGFQECLLTSGGILVASRDIQVFTNAEESRMLGMSKDIPDGFKDVRDELLMSYRQITDINYR